MKKPNRLLTAIGLSMGLVAIGFATSPSFVAQLGLLAPLQSLGNGYWLTALLGGIVLFYAVTDVMTWSLSEESAARPPAVETFPSMPEPGTELDEAVAELTGKRGRAARDVKDRDRIHRRLENDVVETVSRTHGVTRAKAESMIEEGTWTDDRIVAEFVAADEPPDRRNYIFFNRDPFGSRVRRTVDALQDLEVPDGD